VLTGEFSHAISLGAIRREPGLSKQQRSDDLLLDHQGRLASLAAGGRLRALASLASSPAPATARTGPGSVEHLTSTSTSSGTT
jgi:hypothetical protein